MGEAGGTEVDKEIVLSLQKVQQPSCRRNFYPCDDEVLNPLRVSVQGYVQTAAGLSGISGVLPPTYAWISS